MSVFSYDLCSYSSLNISVALMQFILCVYQFTIAISLKNNTQILVALLDDTSFISIFYGSSNICFYLNNDYYSPCI